MSWSDGELRVLAEAYFRGELPRCPRDGTPVRAQEITALGRRTADLYFRCPRCGNSATFENDEPTGSSPPWTAPQRQTIVDDYWRNGAARCPVDETILHIQESAELGHEVTAILVYCLRCGRYFSSDEEQQDEPVGESFEGRYEVLRQIGRGGMGTVDLVKDRRTGALFAAKTIRPDRVDGADSLRRFQREVRLLRGVSHPHVVRIVDDFIAGGTAVYVMEYLPGGDLANALTDPNRGRPALATLFSDAAEAVEHLHGAGVIHRDLKPQNILVDAEGRGRVSDFGLAVASARDTTPLTGTDVFVGTRRYAAPEQHRDARDVTSQADIFSLGLIAIEVVTRLPYPDDFLTMCRGTGQFAAALSRALDLDPTRRTIRPLELAEAVRAHIEREMRTTVTQVARIEVPQNGFTLLNRVTDDDAVDTQLKELGFRRTGKRGWPKKGQLYLGRGKPFGPFRGIYRKEVDPPAGGLSTVDLFELLEEI